MERIDILILFRRVLGVLDRPVGTLQKPLLMFLDVRMVGRRLKRDVERDFDSVAMGRFDEHRSLATHELNAIDTAYHRLDLLPPETQPPIRQLLRDYVTSRPNQYETSDHSASAESRRLQEEIWKESVAAASMSQPNPNSATLVLLPALNNMLDITNTRRNAFNMHPPDAVFLLLLFLSCLCAFIAGFVIKPGHNSWIHMVTFAAIVSHTIGAIFDIEYPHHGLIRLTSYDSYFVALRDSMK